MNNIYPISEDSLLLLKNIKCGKTVLEIGTGNGEISIYCAKNGSNVTAVDIDEEAVDYVRKKAESENLPIKVLWSDLFSNITGKYDTIIFNPPYLPGDPDDLKDLQWAGGGKYGDKIIIKFLKEVDKYLKDDGEIYLILSSFNRIDIIKNFSFEYHLIDKLKLSFHEIYLYKLRKKLKN